MASFFYEPSSDEEEERQSVPDAKYVVRVRPTLIKSKDVKPKESKEDQEISKCAQAYSSALEALNLALEELLKSRTELKTLQAVQTVLLENRLDDDVELADKLNQELRCDNVIPDEVKCPICYEIYSNKIWQCVNGHCICGSCRFKVTGGCSECREPLKVLVRNRALESLLATSLKVDCPNAVFGCQERLKCREVQGHVRICQFRKKSEELLKVERDIEATKEEIKALDKKVDKLNSTAVI